MKTVPEPEYCCKKLEKYWEKEVISTDDLTDDCQYKITIWSGTWLKPVLDHVDICFCPFCGTKLGSSTGNLPQNKYNKTYDDRVIDGT